MISTGIVGMGAYLPTEIRENSFWPQSVVAEWQKRLEHVLARDAVEGSHEGDALVLAALRKFANDPFQGSKQRRVAAAGELSSDMETAAARLALDDAGIALGDVDLLITHSMVPDYLCVNSASIVQHKLGLPTSAMAFSLDAVCTSFLLQMQIAEKWIQTGQAKHVLLTQSSMCTRIVKHSDPFSPWLGDAATAVVISTVPDGYGRVADRFMSDGSMHKAFVANVEGGRYYSEGPVVACVGDKDAAKQMQVVSPSIARNLIGETLQLANIRPTDINFYASHQPAVWFRDVTQTMAGLDNARYVDTFPWAANVSSSNLPLQLCIAKKEGLLKRDDLALTFAYASGLTAATQLLRWY